MAVKIARQTNKIGLLGVPTSAAALSPGHEEAPRALRAAGLAEQLQSLGYEVADLGDEPTQVYKPDDESPRAKNLRGVIAVLDALKPRVEQAIKSGALLLIVSGDGSIALATIAGVRRYYRNVGMIYMARDAGLHTPATTSTGSVEGMVASHLTGRGAAELVRFWGEPPLVREPDLALFGTERLDPVEEEVLRQSPIRRYLADDVRRTGVAAAAKTAIDRIHGGGSPFVLHLNVDVIADFSATDSAGTGGLSFEEVREALQVFARQEHLVAVDVVGYNPTSDSDASRARVIIDLLAAALKARAEALQASAAPVESAASAAAGQSANPSAGRASTSAAPAAAPPAANAPNAPGPATLTEKTIEAALTAAGEAWSSESLEEDPRPAEAATAQPSAETSESPGPSNESDS